MEAYDSAVLSYALATAAHKSRNILDIPSTSGLPRVEEMSLTPPAKGEHKEGLEEVDHQHNLFYQLLCKVEQNLVSRAPLQVQDLMEICTLKQNDTQTTVLVDTLQQEIRQLFKQGSSLILDIEERKQHLSKSEKVCKILLELCTKYGLSEGMDVLKNYLS